MSLVRLGCCVMFLVMLTACLKPRQRAYRAPGIRVTFASASEEDAAVLRRGLERRGARALTAEELGSEDAFGFELPVQLPRDFTLDDLGEAANEWHDVIVRLAPETRGQIAESIGTTLVLAYGSTDAKVETNAILRIRPDPPGARILIDGPRPAPLPDPSVEADYLQLELPFSFIKAHDYVYFRSVLDGVTRYFEYDLASEQQRAVSGIRSMEDWAYYRRHRRVPR
ncbi:MAG: hypothetical protein RL885_09475 [Planctomycetota bacterium]